MEETDLGSYADALCGIPVCTSDGSILSENMRWQVIDMVFHSRESCECIVKCICNGTGWPVPVPSDEGAPAKKIRKQFTRFANLLANPLSISQLTNLYRNLFRSKFLSKFLWIAIGRMFCLYYFIIQTKN